MAPPGAATAGGATGGGGVSGGSEARAGETLYNAVLANDLAAVESMLEAGKQPNDLNQCGPAHKKTSPLHEAAIKGNDRICTALLAAGAQLNHRDASGHTPLHVAVQHLGVVKVLVDEGAEVNATSKRGRTPLHRAAIEGDSSIVNMLLHAGADMTLKDDSGATARDDASRKGMVPAVQAMDSFKTDAASRIKRQEETARIQQQREADRATREEKAAAAEHATKCFAQGEAFCQTTSWESAVLAFSEALQSGYSDEVKCHSWLSFCFDQLGRNAEALQEIEMVVAIQPTSDSYFNRGRLLQGMGQIEEALRSFEQCAGMETDPIRKLEATSAVEACRSAVERMSGKKPSLSAAAGEFVPSVSAPSFVPGGQPQEQGWMAEPGFDEGYDRKPSPRYETVQLPSPLDGGDLEDQPPAIELDLWKMGSGGVPGGSSPGKRDARTDEDVYGMGNQDNLAVIDQLEAMAVVGTDDWNASPTRGGGGGPGGARDAGGGSKRHSYGVGGGAQFVPPPPDGAPRGGGPSGMQTITMSVGNKGSSAAVQGGRGAARGRAIGGRGRGGGGSRGGARATVTGTGQMGGYVGGIDLENDLTAHIDTSTRKGRKQAQKLLQAQKRAAAGPTIVVKHVDQKGKNAPQNNAPQNNASQQSAPQQVVKMTGKQQQAHAKRIKNLQVSLKEAQAVAAAGGGNKQQQAKLLKKVRNLMTQLQEAQRVVLQQQQVRARRPILSSPISMRSF